MGHRTDLGTSRGLLAVACVLGGLVPLHGLGAQDRPTGLQVGALPALNFDSDEGVGYGALAELYQYGDGTRTPYRWTLQPTVFLTTEGRRDLTLFVDAPHLLPGGWRIDAYLGHEKQIATPWYGIGNDTEHDETLERDEGPNPFYYRFGRTRRSLRLNAQHALGDPRLRVLAGFGFVRTSTVAVPEGDGTTLYAEEVGGDVEGSDASYARLGLVWDTRDRETGPTDGSWIELLFQRVDEALGADASYWRWTFAGRGYTSLRPGLVYASRLLVQGVGSGAAPHDLFLVQTSFKQQEGLGGAKTVRGIPKNRYVGRGLLLLNQEIRWRAAEFRWLGRDFHTVLSAFLDGGRVWAGAPRLAELSNDWHTGYGGGVRLGMGEDFVVAVDAGTSSEAGLGLYIGLGYLF